MLVVVMMAMAMVIVVVDDGVGDGDGDGDNDGDGNNDGNEDDDFGNGDADETMMTMAMLMVMVMVVVVVVVVVVVIASFADALLARTQSFLPNERLLIRAGKNVDQSQQTSRSGKCTLDSECFRMSIRTINMAIAGVDFQRVCETFSSGLEF